MKKFGKVLALFIAVLMVASIQLPAMAAQLGDKVAEKIPTLENLTKNNCTALGTSSQTLNSSQMMVENDKYIFVAIGMKEAYNFRVCSAVQIFDKATGELLTTITQKTGNATWYAPLRNMYVDGDVLYIQWGNAVNNPAGVALRPVINEASLQAPILAYNVAYVTEGSSPAQLMVFHGNAYTADALPYTQGGISYLDAENDVLYSSYVGKTAPTSPVRYYHVYETAGMSDAIATGTAPANKVIYIEGIESVNTAQFFVKDGYLFEVIKNKAGMVDYATDTLTTNNQVRVYKLPATLKASNSLTNQLKGVYTTDVAGVDEIRDVEVAGDYMYVATSAGIEVVSLAPAKAAGASASTELTSTIVAETGVGGTADLDVSGNSLFAAYTGTQYYAATGASSAAGALVVYDITTPATPVKTAEKSVDYGLREISVNAEYEIIYALQDVFGPPSMTAFSYTPDVIVEEEDFEFTAIKLNGSTTLTAGTFDISVELTNPDLVTGTVICAVYEGNKLANVFVDADYAGATSVTMAEDYVVTGAVTEIKAMFLDSLTGELRPLIPSISISK